MRGWSHVVGRVVGEDVVGPAHAGMVPRSDRTPPPDIKVGPAHAGMVLRLRPRACGPRSRPRACGDGPTVTRFFKIFEKSAPRMRGWSEAREGAEGAQQVGPAHAGMVLRTPDRRLAQSRRPRACGDGPVPSDATQTGVPSAPRMRGWSLGQSRSRRGELVGPAHPGMVRRRHRRAACSAGRPRACGDGPMSVLRLKPLPGSAPRMRGWSRGIYLSSRIGKVGPSHTGMVRGAIRPSTRSMRRPRVSDGDPGSRTPLRPPSHRRV